MDTWKYGIYFIFPHNHVLFSIYPTCKYCLTVILQN